MRNSTFLKYQHWLAKISLFGKQEVPLGQIQQHYNTTYMTVWYAYKRIHVPQK